MAPTLNEIFELKCLTELEDVGPVALFIGLLAIPLCLLMPVPQYYKLLQRGSAAGFSGMMLFIGNIGRALNMINLFILHFDQIQLCLSGPGMLRKCQPSLLVMYSGITGFLSLFPMYFVVLFMNTRRSATGTGGRTASQNRMLWFGLISQIVIIVLVASPIYLVIRNYANIIGFFNAFFLCTQFIPQIVLTWTRREGGAVSYMMYLPDAIGGYIMTVEKAFGTHERISTWLPYALMHTLELIMLIINAAFDDSFRDWLRVSIKRPRFGQSLVPEELEELDDSSIAKRDTTEHTYMRARSLSSRSPSAPKLGEDPPVVSINLSK